MEKVYVKFKETRKPEANPKTWLSKIFENSLTKLLTAVIPKANPDFDDKLDLVDQWLIEIDKESEMTEREIGINAQGRTIMIMPFNRNYGYWTDCSLTLSEFIEWFNATPIDAKEFNYRWDRYENGHWD